MCERENELEQIVSLSLDFTWFHLSHFFALSSCDTTCRPSIQYTLRIFFLFFLCKLNDADVFSCFRWPIPHVATQCARREGENIPSCLWMWREKPFDFDQIFKTVQRRQLNTSNSSTFYAETMATEIANCLNTPYAILKTIYRSNPLRIYSSSIFDNFMALQSSHALIRHLFRTAHTAGGEHM